MRRLEPGLVILLVMIFTATAVESADDLAGRTPKSKQTARMLSLGSTILPIALGIALTTSESEPMDELGVFLIGGGLIIGPGMGQAYADRPVRFAAGAIIRTLCLGLAASAAIVGTAGHNDPPPTCGTSTLSDGPKYAFFVGLGGYVIMSTWDIATVSGAVDSYNRKHAAREFRFGHFYQPREQTHGVALTLRF